MFIRWIINCFKKRKKQKIDTRNYVLKKYKILKRFYNNRINVYCTKGLFNNIIKQIADLKNVYNLHKKIFTEVEQNQINDLVSLSTKYKNHEQFNQDFIITTIKFLPKDFFLFKTINLDNNRHLTLTLDTWHLALFTRPLI